MMEKGQFIETLTAEYRKRCISCKEEKPAECFYKRPSEADGYSNQCRVCKKEYQEARKKKKEVESMYYSIV